MIRLLKPLSYYKEKYGSALYGLDKLYLIMEKEHNRGQEAAGIGCVKLDTPPGQEYIFRERAQGSDAISRIFANAHQRISEELAEGSDPETAPFVGEVYMGDETVKEKIAEYTKRLARALHVKGLINIQFIAIGEEVYVIEVNPRSSRTVPYISKVTGIPIVDLAVEVIIGKTIRELGYEPGLQKEADYVAIKMPVFSFEKIRGAEISLGPEMKSTGECLGIAGTFQEALYKAFLGSGVDLPKFRQMILTVKDADKGEAIEIGRRFEKLGYTVYATRSTAAALREAGVKARKVNKIQQESPTVMDLILGHKIDLVIDTPTQGRDKSRDGFLIRRTAIETGVNCLTSLDTARALVTSLENARTGELTLIDVASLS